MLLSACCHGNHVTVVFLQRTYVLCMVWHVKSHDEVNVTFTVSHRRVIVADMQVARWLPSETPCRRMPLLPACLVNRIWMG